MTTNLHTDDPTEGFYKTRLVKGGPFVPVHIVRLCVCSIGGFELHGWSDACDRFPEVTAMRNGEEVAVTDVWPYCACWPIDQDEYDFLLADSKWCVAHAPLDPKAQPRQAVNPNNQRPLF